MRKGVNARFRWATYEIGGVFGFIVDAFLCCVVGIAIGIILIYIGS